MGFQGDVLGFGGRRVILGHREVKLMFFFGEGGLGFGDDCEGQFWHWWVGRVLGLGVGVGILGNVFGIWRWDRLGLQGDELGLGGRRIVVGHRDISYLRD